MGSGFHPATGEPGNPNEHIISLVSIDDKSYIADVAFGGRCAYEPLLFVCNEELEDPNGIFRYTMVDDLYDSNASLRPLLILKPKRKCSKPLGNGEGYLDFPQRPYPSMKLNSLMSFTP